PCSFYYIYALIFFFSYDTASAQFFSLSLHDALPISWVISRLGGDAPGHHLALGNMFHKVLEEEEDFSVPALWAGIESQWGQLSLDRKSTRLNSSHVKISYAVFCLKKKKKNRSTYKMD